MNKKNTQVSTKIAVAPAHQRDSSESSNSRFKQSRTGVKHQESGKAREESWRGEEVETGRRREPMMAVAERSTSHG